LLSDDVVLARELAAQMDSLNQERRSIEASMQAEALVSLNALTLDETELPWGLCLLEDNWHQGVVGILASRIKDKYHRPVIAFAEVDDHTIKGSARSISGLHIRDALDMLATQNPEILQKFGGHAMAAGLSIERKNFPRFSELFDKVIRSLLTQDQLQEVLLTDGELSTREISLQNAHALAAAGPWGQQFAEPVFNGCFKVISQRIVGEKHLKMTHGFLDDPQKIIDAIAFNIDVDCWPNTEASHINIVYQLSVNEFRGNETEQLMVRHIEAV
jgi:single-stranded-DNA-specific exonuclease